MLIITITLGESLNKALGGCEKRFQNLVKEKVRDWWRAAPSLTAWLQPVGQVVRVGIAVVALQTSE